MRYRCTRKKSCGQRVKLRKPIDQYARRPLCPACGNDSLKLDAAHYRRKRKLKCVCPGVPYPHERGTVVGCEHYAKPMTEEMWHDYLDQLKAASLRAA